MEKGERQLYLDYLTESQKEVLERYHKEEKNSVLQNQIFGQSDEWELIDIKVNANYHDTDQREAGKLYCMCDRPLKYQYVLVDRVENQILKLGIEHFKQHADIPDNIARQILKKKYQLDEWLDDILLTVKKHKLNNQLKTQYKQTIDEFMTKTNDAPIEQRIPLNQGVITEKDLKLFHDFKDVGLPLPTKLYNKIEQALQSYKEKQSAEEREKELWAVIRGKNKLKQPQTPKVSNQKQINNKSKTNQTYGVNQDIAHTHKGAIADCRMAMDKLFNKSKQIPFNTLYLEIREPMERLFKAFDKETVIQLIAKSMKQHSNNEIKVDWQAKTFIKTGEKT